MLSERTAANDEEELRGCLQDARDFEADHHSEPVENAQELRDFLLPEATLQDVMQALLRTCKGCA